MAGTNGRGSRGARALRLLLRLAVLTAVGLAGGCGGSSSQPPPEAAPPPAARTCGEVRPTLGCREIQVGGRAYRYSLQRPRGGVGSAAVLVDLGGPGRALFGGDDLLAFAREWPTDEALLFLEEPWVTEPIGTACDSALSAFYRGLRGVGAAAAAAELGEACGLATPGRWGWTAGAYADVVDAVAAEEQLELVGLVGTSYGAVRTKAVLDRPSVRWLVLNSPAPPAATGAEYVAGLRDAVLEALARACARCDGAAGALRLAERAAAALAANPVELATRTPLVEPVDVPAALVGLTHLPVAQRAELAAGLERPVGAAAQAIGRLSDGTLLRYGEYELSPATLAYLDEICRAYGPWEEGGSDLVARFLTELHAPCRQLEPAPTGAPSAPRAVCIAHGGEDFVTPAGVVAEWRRLYPRARLVERPRALHGTPELASACRLSVEEVVG